MTELGPEARALLDAARAGLSPDAAAVSRVRAKIHHTAAAGGAGTALGLKLLVVGIVGAVAAVAGGVYLQHRPAGAVARAVALASPAGLGAAPPPSPALPVTREPPPPVGADDALIAIEAPPAVPRSPGPAPAVHHPSSSAPASRRAIAATPVAASRVVPARPAVDLAREVELVDLAMAALRRGDAGAALVTVRRHAAETAGDGQLAEDAAAIEIEALCQLHDPTRSAKLTAFDARFPRSAQRSRLDRSCR